MHDWPAELLRDPEGLAAVERAASAELASDDIEFNTARLYAQIVRSCNSAG